MRTNNPSSLGDAARLNEPAVSPDLSGADYIKALYAGAENLPGKEPPKARVCINTFKRYIQSRRITKIELQQVERLLERIHTEMDTGRFLNRNREAYGSLKKQFVGSIRRVHNSLVGEDPRFLRALIDHRRYERYCTFLGFTDTTKRSMIWFEKNARVKTKNGNGSAMTERTREAGIASALSVLQHLNLNGLEDITSKMVMDALGAPDPHNKAYRSLMWNIHNLRPLFRACVDEGLLPLNPLTEVPDEKFDHLAVQDFLLPEEMNKLRDLQTLDMANETQVRDRLTCLLYADAAIRKAELSALKLPQVRCTGQQLYTLVLDSAGQKMSNKSQANIPLLYLETGKLLDHYLKHIRPKYPGDQLIINDRGEPASADVCARQVTREAKRIGVSTHAKGKLPSPHDLRRTFATLNIESLGLGLSLFDMAERLRDSVNVVTKHYVQGNPMLQEHKAVALRKKARGQDDPENLIEHLDALQAAGLPIEALSTIRAVIEERRAPADPETEEAVEDDPVDWVPYDEGQSLLKHAWGVLPFDRKLRDYLRSQQASTRTGKGGHLHVDRKAIDSLANDHMPLDSIVDPATLNESTIRSIQRQCQSFRIGGMIVLKKEESLAVSKLLAKVFTQAV